MSINSKDLRDKIHELQFEPTRVAGMTYDLLEESLTEEGGYLLDPGQPLPLTVEVDSVLTHAAIESFNATALRMYPSMAQTDEDLYLHMSDVDMVDMFASPGEAEMIFLLNKAEVIARSVPVNNSRSRKMVIPKHTEVDVNGFTFTMQYPINIVIKSHGGVEIMYDGSTPSPLQTLRNTSVDWAVRRMGSDVQGQTPGDWLLLKVPMKQMRLTTYRMDSNMSTIAKASFEFEDKYTYCRAYRQIGQNQWEEISTTHSDHTFDIQKPTLLLKVVDQTLKVELPHIYQQTGLASATFRIDIYTTRGDVYSDLSSLQNAQFVTNFRDLDHDDNDVYTSVIGQLDSIRVLSTDALSGGNNGPTFLERRERMLQNSIGPVSKPIAPTQVENTLDKLGFDVVQNHDDALGRTYQVSRTMLEHVNGLTTAPIDSAVMTAKITAEKLKEYATVVENEFTMTVLPSTLYKDVDGVLEIVSDDERTTLGQAGNDTKVNALSNNRYLYTPLHYLLDLEDSRFEVRPYYFTNPSVDITGFSASNDTLDVFVQSSNDIFVTYDDQGFLLTVVTESNDSYKAMDDSQAIVQLAFKPDVESELVYVNGALIGHTDDDKPERIYQFRIGTNWDVKIDHQLVLTSFSLREDTVQYHDTPLKGEFFLIWMGKDYTVPGMETSEVDDTVGKHLISGDTIGIYRETLELTLGHELTGLWRRSQPMIGAQEYEVYEDSLQYTYPSNVYEYDVNGDIIIETDPDTGLKSLKVLHAKGDLVFKSDGTPDWIYQAGDPKRNEFGDLIPLDGRKVEWWWDIVLFDAKYRYATRDADEDYARGVADVMVEWVNDTLTPIKEMALERTEFYFHPRNSLKYVQAIVNDGDQRSVYTAQSLVVELYLTKAAYEQPTLREAMQITTTKVIGRELSKTQITMTGLKSALKTALGDELVGSRVLGLGGSDEIELITLVDPTTRLCVAKALSVESDGSLAIKDDLVIDFKRHDLM